MLTCHPQNLKQITRQIYINLYTHRQVLRGEARVCVFRNGLRRNYMHDLTTKDSSVDENGDENG